MKAQITNSSPIISKYVDMADKHDGVLEDGKAISSLSYHQEDGDGQPSQEESNLKKFKVAKTSCVVIVWICYGMMHSVSSPTLPDLRDRLDTNMEDLSLALGFRNFGALAGSVICGMLADRYRGAGDVIMGSAVIIAGFPEIIKPLTDSLIVVGAVSFIGGLGQGGLEAVGHGIILWMWADKSGPPFHAIHMGYPIGAMLAPLIAMPFLSPDDTDATTTSPYDTITPSGECNGTTLWDATVTGQPGDASRIEIPFGIIGGTTCLVGLVFMVWYFIGTPKGFVYHGTEKSSILQVFSPATCAAMGSVAYTCTLLTLICLLLVFVSAKDSTIGTYVFSYAVESDLAFTKQEAAKLDATARAMAIVGRVLGVMASHWFRIQPMLFVEVILNTVFTICLAVFGTQSQTNLWAFTCMFRLTCSPVWPSVMTWTSVYLKFSSMIVSLTQVVLGITGYLTNWLAGYIYDNFPDWILFYAMFCGFVVLGILVTMQIVASCCARRGGDGAENTEVEVVHTEFNKDQMPIVVNLETEKTRL